MRKKTSVTILEEQIYNTLDMLQTKGMLYTFNGLKREQLDEKTIRLTWNNHEPGNYNTGDCFLKIEQYQKILKNRSYLCLLFDGSLIRVSYTFREGLLTGHNLLWWPAPYKYDGVTFAEVEPVQMLSDFMEDDKWFENIEMRSPIRIDYDPVRADTGHPSVHMHLEHKNCRICVEKPVCFNRFIKYIFSNFYPDCEIYLNSADYLDFGIINNFETKMTKIVL